MTRKESKRPEKDQGNQSGIEQSGKKQMAKRQDGGKMHETVEGSRAEGAAGEAGGQRERDRK